jgi:ATP-binding cassette subfamily G (WHITE) protein 2 (SNQ2)
MFGIKTSELWRGVGVLFALVVFFLACTIMVGEKVSFATGGGNTKFYIKENSQRKGLNSALAEKKNKRRQKGQEAEKAELEIKSKATLTWEDLTYDVPTAGGSKRLLNEISGYVQPGYLTALMGASGYAVTFYRIMRDSCANY